MRWAAENRIDTTKTYRNGVEKPGSLSTVTQPGALKIVAVKAGTPDLRLAFKLSVLVEGNYSSSRPVRTTAS